MQPGAPAQRSTDVAAFMSAAVDEQPPSTPAPVTNQPLSTAAPVRDQPPSTPASFTKQAEAGDVLAGVLGEALGDETDAEAAGGIKAAGSKGANSDNEDDKAVIKAVNGFYWAAYRAVFGSTPLHVAVTALFAECALVIGRISGHLHHHFPGPMTVEETKELGELCSNFVLNYVNPVLGPMASMKIQKHLCHIVGAIKLHGSLSNGNTATNESLHVHEKQCYCRTNHDVDGFRYQLLREGQGTLELRARHEQEEEQEWLDEEGELWAAGMEDGSDSEADGRKSSAVAACQSGTRVPTRADKLSVAVLSKRPGMGSLGEVLSAGPEDSVQVTNSLPIQALFECCAASARQILRAASLFRGKPWFDRILYEDDDHPGRLCYGEARAIVRSVGGEGSRVVVVSALSVCEREPGCPLVSRGCTRLCWAMDPEDEWPALRLVPFASVRRLLHVVPEMEALTARRGIAASLPAFSSSAVERRAARFYVNAFFPRL